LQLSHGFAAFGVEFHQTIHNIRFVVPLSAHGFTDELRIVTK
jgi:hypothetical protein